MRAMILVILLTAGATAQGISIDRIDRRVPDPSQLRIGTTALVCWCVNRAQISSQILIFASTSKAPAYKIPGTNLNFNLVPAFPWYGTPMRGAFLWEPWPYFWEVPNVPALLGHTIHVQVIGLDRPTFTKIIATSNYLTMTFVRP